MKNRAIEFDKLAKSKTFLILGLDNAESKINLIAYFTLSLQVFKVPEKLSNRKIKEWDGFSAKVKSKVITEFPVILIGQLGKNDEYKDKILGSELMQYCLSTVLDGQQILGGRIILLECKNTPYLVDKFYPKFGFKKIESDCQPNDELIQFIKVIGNEK